ncbi:MAG TPA: GAF domain-containing protein [Terriglobales bacterium]|nr:GAF domain-containing protein [Terriglobales bacterium]
MDYNVLEYYPTDFGTPAEVKDKAIITQESPTASQPSFQQLLAAAFIVQEHNDKLHSTNDPDAAYTRTLAEIVETERLIQDPRVDFHTALELIAERTHTVTRADGVALGLLENGKLIYRADTGDAATQLNAPALITETLAAECFRTGKALQSTESRSDDRIDPILRQQLGVESLLAVPIRQEGKISGVLELRFKRPNAFQPSDLRTLQLMSGLAGEVLGKKAKQGWKQALASSEEAAVRSVLDHIQPELDRFEDHDEEFARAVSSLTGDTSQLDLHSIDLTHSEPPPPAEAMTHVSKPPAQKQKHSGYSETLCVRCGHAFAGDESFCGLCGAMRGEDSPVVLNPKTPAWTSLWDIQASASTEESVIKQPSNGDGASRSNGHSFSHQNPAYPEPSDQDLEETVSRLSGEPEFEEAEDVPVRFAAEEENRRAETHAVFNLAGQETQAHLEVEEEPAESGPVQESLLAKVWREQRATLYLAAALGVLAVVIVTWILQPPPPAPTVAAAPTPATIAQAVPAPRELSTMDKMLVGLGLAEAPSAPVHLGNPDAKVWQDVHTALYYCAGAELYGNTKGGKITRQRDAQLDQFQPAAGKACE